MVGGLGKYIVYIRFGTNLVYKDSMIFLKKFLEDKVLLLHIEFCTISCFKHPMGILEKYLADMWD